MHLRSKTVQQLLSVILSVVMILSMLPMEVLAQETPPVTTPMDLTAITEDTSGDGWSWTQSTKTLTLSVEENQYLAAALLYTADGSICLHARYIRFVHPVSKELIEVEAPVPPGNLWNGFETI